MDTEAEIKRIIDETRRLMVFDELAEHLVRRLGEVWLGATVYALEEGEPPVLKPVRSSVLTPREMEAYRLPVGDRFLGGKRVFVDNVYTDGHHAVVPLETDRRHGILQVFGQGLEEYIPLLAMLKHPIGVSMANARQYDAAIAKAEHDPLTGLYNQRKFMEELEKAMWRVGRSEINSTSAVMLELDRFREQNNRYGWTNVNQHILVPAAGMFGSVRASRDTGGDVMAARYGGDEFTLRVDGSDVEAAGVAERYRRETENAAYRIPKNGKWETAKITLSGGVASYSGKEYRGPEDMMGAAEEAVHHAKAHGGNATYINAGGRIQRNPWDKRA